MSKSIRLRAIVSSIEMAITIGAIATAGVVVPALGQTTTPQNNANTKKAKKPETLQAIQVTGSHIPGAEMAAVNPIVTVTAQQIAATGKLTVGSVLQQLPQVAGSIHTPNLDFGGNTGATFIGLRGLGASRTLVLIDGQRVQGVSNQNANDSVDLNSIPAAAIERIEVLTNGASAIYGSDAIGGVINIILKPSYQGAEFSGNYGISSHGDGQRRGGTFMFGQITDKGSILGGVSYNKFDPIVGEARRFSRNTLFLTTTTNGARTSVLGAGGNGGRGNYLGLTLPPNLVAKLGCQDTQFVELRNSSWTAGASPTTLADYQCLNSDNFSHNYNAGATQYLVTPQERTNAFFRGSYKLSNHVSAFFTYLYNKTSSAAQIPPPEYGTSEDPQIAVSKNSYYNPFGIDFSINNGNLLGNLLPTGMGLDQGTTTFNYAFAGLRGHDNVFGHRWSWDVGLDYSHISQLVTEHGTQNVQQLAEGAGPSFLNAAGVVQCGTPSSPISLSACTPWDPFNSNAPSTLALAQSLLANPTPVENSTYIQQRNYHADLNGGIVDLPAGTLKFAVGVAYRQVYINGVNAPGLRINPETGTCLFDVGGSCNSAALHGGFDVHTAYGQLNIPLLHDMPFARELGLTIGDRESRYSNFGGTNDWEAGLSYRPVSSLLLRGTVSKVFRAPTISNMFLQPFTSGQLLTSDPCDFVAPTPDAANPRAGSPVCVGVPPHGTFQDQAVLHGGGVTTLITGSQFAGFPLDPEKGKTFDFGAVYSPPFVPGLTVHADLWRIYLNNLITSVSAQAEIDQCADGVTDFCPLLRRIQAGAAAGQLFQVITPTVNLGRFDTKGVDFGGTYKIPYRRFGLFTVGLHGTYLTQFKAQTDPGKSDNIVSNGAGLMAIIGTPIGQACPGNSDWGGTCYMPRLRGQASVRWLHGDWSAQWTLHYLGRFHIADDPLSVVGVDQYGAMVYNDVTVGVDVPAIRTRFNFGIDNLFNRSPPLLFDNRVSELNTDTEDFDPVGRYYWARFTTTF